MLSYLRMIQAVTVRYNDKIIKEMKPLLDYFELEHFWYNRISDQGFLSTICNHAMWSEFFAYEKFYLKYPFLRHSRCVQQGIRVLNDFHIHADTPLTEILDVSREKYDMQVWISILDKTEDGVEEIGFSTRKPNPSLILNELPLIKLFTKKFREENKPLFSKLEDNQVDLVELIGSAFHESSLWETPQSKKRQALLQKLGIELPTPLSSREREVMVPLLKGYSASQIGKQVFLSKRTVEHHVERMKEKWGCDSKAELIQKARELEQLGYFSCGV